MGKRRLVTLLICLLAVVICQDNRSNALPTKGNLLQRRTLQSSNQEAEISNDTSTQIREQIPALHERLLSQLSSFTQSVFKDKDSDKEKEKDKDKYKESQKAKGDKMLVKATSNKKKEQFRQLIDALSSSKPGTPEPSSSPCPPTSSTESKESPTASVIPTPSPSHSLTTDDIDNSTKIESSSPSSMLIDTNTTTKTTLRATAEETEAEKETKVKVEVEAEMSESEEQKKMGLVGKLLIPVFARVHRRAARLSTIPERLDEQVLIGKSRIAGRRVTTVGDVDSNGIIDYIVCTPSARNDSGNIRLYLMAKDNKFLYTRDLIPGKHGFDAPPLKPGAKYGTAVTRIPGNATYIAVSAPGECAVYVLKLNKYGDVLKFAKAVMDVQKLNQQLRLTHDEDDENTLASDAEVKDEQNNETDTETDRELQLLGDVSSVVFEAADGEVLAKIQVDAKRDRSLLAKVENEYIHPSSSSPESSAETSLKQDSVARETLPNLSIRTLRPLRKSSSKIDINGNSDKTERSMKGIVSSFSAKCLFNQTHCACAPAKSTPNAGLDHVGPEGISGRETCIIRGSERSVVDTDENQGEEPRYECHCDGDMVCTRKAHTSDRYVVEEGAALARATKPILEDVVFCRREKISSMEVRPVVSMMNADKNLRIGNQKQQQAAAQMSLSTMELHVSNKTHCVCDITDKTLKNYDTKPGNNAHEDCYRFSNIAPRRAVFCQADACPDMKKLGLQQQFACTPDGSGTAYCMRGMSRHDKWVFDGDVPDRDRVVFCHRQRVSTERVQLLFHL